MVHAGTSPGSSGFEGGIAGLGLPDLLQLSAQNQFSGCFRIQHETKVGLLFFRDGEIVHAEEGDAVGEEAFCNILGWPQGRFSTEPNLVAARRTIHKGCEHLLLEAHRVLDERRAGREQPSPAPRPQAPAVAPRPGGAARTVRGVPGVSATVLMGRDGKRLADDGYETEVLAGQAFYLAIAGAELGALFQAGELRSGSVQGSLQHLLIYSNGTHHLGVSAGADQDVGAVDDAIRKALTKGG